ncbi:MAG TPA: hypothetical protein VE994_03080 [Terriglobales bacterium]|nr:hypothetical protein [Terriglobales bacterium]
MKKLATLLVLVSLIAGVYVLGYAKKKDKKDKDDKYRVHVLGYPNAYPVTFRTLGTRCYADLETVALNPNAGGTGKSDTITFCAGDGVTYTFQGFTTSPPPINVTGSTIAPNVCLGPYPITSGTTPNTYAYNVKGLNGSLCDPNVIVK